MINTIREKILRGEPVHIMISGSDDTIVSFRTWLGQFKRLCDGRCSEINCNSIISRQGIETLDVRIGVIPHGQRELLAGTLESANTSTDSLCTIKEKE